MSINYFLKYFKFFIVSLFVVGIFTSYIFTGEIKEFHFVGLFLCLFFYLLIKRSAFKKSFYDLSTSYLNIFCIALLLRLIFIFIFAEYLEYLNGFPFINQKDDFKYNDVALEIAKNWKIQGFNFQSDIMWSTGFYSGFPNFSALLMYFFGENLWVPRIGNAFLSAYTVVYFAKVSNILFPKDVSKLAIVLMIFSPIFITYSSLQLKDTLLLFLICGTFFYFLRLLTERFSILYIILIVLFLTAMIFVRAATVPPIILSGLVCIYYAKKNKVSISHRVFSIIFFFVILTGIIFLWDVLSLNGLLESPETYFTTRYNILFGDDAITRQSSAISGTGLAFLLSTPLFLAGSLFLPIPLVVELPDFDHFTNYYFTAHLFLFALIPFFIQALTKWFKNRQQHKFLMLFVSFFFMYKIGQAFSLSLFSLRQSLPAVLCMQFILPIIFMYRPSRNRIMISFVICLLCMVAFAFVRLSTRSLI